MKTFMRAVYTDNNINGRIITGQKKIPAVGAKDILVRMHAASVNPIDWRFIGYIAPFYPFSMTLGHDGAGEVVAVGKGVSQTQVGDWVYGLKVYPLRGSFAEYCCLREDQVALAPDNVSPLEAAALPLVGLTALQAFRWARLKPGQHVLVIGGSGGVGHIALQVAKAQGARVTAVCSTRNMALVRSLGADDVIDYTQQDPLQVANDVDVVLDTVGHLSHRQCQSVLKPGGYYVCTFPNRRSAWEILLSVTLGKVLRRWRRSWFVMLNANRQDLAALSSLVREGKVRVVIDRVFGLDDVEAAFNVSKQSRTTGKNVVVIKSSD